MGGVNGLGQRLRAAVEGYEQAHSEVDWDHHVVVLRVVNWDALPRDHVFEATGHRAKDPSDYETEWKWEGGSAECCCGNPSCNDRQERLGLARLGVPPGEVTEHVAVIPLVRKEDSGNEAAA